MRQAKRFARVRWTAALTAACLTVGLVDATAAMVSVVHEGEARVSGIYIPAEDAEIHGIEAAAADLAAAIARMSGATVPVRKVAAAGDIPAGPAIVLGAPAGELGAAPRERTPWRDTMRTVIGNGRVLIDGESGIAVNDAVMELLHELGVRYFLPQAMWNDIGTVIPERTTIAWTERDHERRPHIRARRIAGANVDADWNRRNHGQSPIEIVGRHAWGSLIPVRQRRIGDPLEAYSAVLEYGPDGHPARRGGQFCVSNPDVAPAVAAVLMERFREHPDRVSQSISPNDGGGHCICPNCRALDVPDHREPSTGLTAVSDRYLDFYNRIAAMAGTDRERGVIDFFRSGLRQGELTIAMINHLNGFEFLEAREARDELHALNADLEQQKVISELPRRYLRWFMDHVVEHAAAVLDAGGQIAVEFPNEWRFRLDYYDVGVEEHWFDPAHGNRRWLTAQTWGAPSLYSQGFGDFKGPQWFKVDIEVPVDGAADMSIWFGSNDGRTRLWVNGEPVTFAVADGDAVRGVYEWPRGWRAFSAPVGQLLSPGETNTFVVRVDHSSISDLNLGGILRPVMLYIPGPAEMKAVEDTYQRMVM